MSRFPSGGRDADWRMSGERDRVDSVGGLQTRVISALLLIPIVGLPFLAGQPWLSLLIGLIAVIAAQEAFGLLRRASLPTQPILGTAGVVLLIADAHLNAGQSIGGMAVIALLVLALAAETLQSRDLQLGLVRWAATIFGVLYIGLLGFALRIAQSDAAVPAGGLLDAGRTWLLIVVLGVWAFDTTAYVAGRAIGRGPFFSHISPAKTWSGVVGGTIGAVLVCTLLTSLVGGSPVLGSGLGLIVAITGQIGDLSASLLKRAAGVKDSGRLIPGHGGVLDRIDSILFAVPAAFIFLSTTNTLQ